MPANRYGGSGRYYHGDADGKGNKNRNNAPSAPMSAAHKATVKVEKGTKLNTEAISKATPKKEENNKFKPAFNSPKGDIKSSGVGGEDHNSTIEKSNYVFAINYTK